MSGRPVRLPAPRARCTRCRTWIGPTLEFRERAGAVRSLVMLIANRCGPLGAAVVDTLIRALLRREGAFALGQCVDCFGLLAEERALIDAVAAAPLGDDAMHRRYAAASLLAQQLAASIRPWREVLEAASIELAEAAARKAAEGGSEHAAPAA